MGDDEKPSTRRLGSLGSQKSAIVPRLGTLKADEKHASNAPASRSRINLKPQNFNKMESSKKEEPSVSIPPPTARRLVGGHRGGGRVGGRVGADTQAGGLSRHHQSQRGESAVIFGGGVGVASGAATLEGGGSKKKLTKAGGGPAIAPATIKKEEAPEQIITSLKSSKDKDGSKSKSRNKKKLKNEQEGVEETGSDEVESSDDSDSDVDDDDGAMGIDDDGYNPTLLREIRKREAANEDGRSVPRELMTRSQESETALNDILRKRFAAIDNCNTIDSSELMLFQLPSILPLPAHPHSSSSFSGQPGSGRPTALSQLPPGKIGKLLVLKNGSVKIQIGQVLFDVSPGIECQMLQEFVAVDATQASKELIVLGQIKERVVFTPNLESLLSNEPLKPWVYAKLDQKVTGTESGGKEEQDGKHKKASKSTPTGGNKNKDILRVIMDDDSDDTEDDVMVVGGDGVVAEDVDDGFEDGVKGEGTEDGGDGADGVDVGTAMNETTTAMEVEIRRDEEDDDRKGVAVKQVPSSKTSSRRKR